MLIHTVLFWLRKDISSEDRKHFEHQLKTLEKIPSVNSFHLGSPAATEKRPVIDDSYDYGITVVLEDLKAHDAYQIDPIHKEFIGSCSKFWEKVKIYDFD
jgi:hypothetical protein